MVRFSCLVLCRIKDTSSYLVHIYYRSYHLFVILLSQEWGAYTAWLVCLSINSRYDNIFLYPYSQGWLCFVHLTFKMAEIHFNVKYWSSSGLFSNHGPLYFVATKKFFSKKGLACHIAKIHSEVTDGYFLLFKNRFTKVKWTFICLTTILAFCPCPYDCFFPN